MGFFSTKWRQILGLSLVLSITWIVFTTYQSSHRTDKIYLVPQIGFEAPDFTLSDIDGNNYHLKSLKGTAVVLNVWASWCTPCQAEMPAIQDVYEKYSNENVIILGVNDTKQDSVSEVLDFIKSKNLTFPILYDFEGEVSNAYQVQALPTTFFINPQGIIDDIVIGGPMSEALLEIRIKKLIGER